MAKKPSNLLYSVEGHPPFWTTIGLGIQHAFVTAMLLVLPVIVVQEMNGTPAQAQSMIRWSLVAGGIGAILQALYRGPVGSGYLCPQLCGPAYLSASVLAARSGGLSLVFGMTLLAGMFEVPLSRLIPRLRAFFPAEVTGFIVTMVGISLIRAATLNFLNLGNPDTAPQASHVVVACITLATMVGLNV